MVIPSHETTMGEDQLQLEELGFGSVVYDEQGRELGTVRGVDEDGFYVTVREGVEALSADHVRSESTFGEAELMWRCWNCGEMGTIGGSGLPEECPNCDSPKEDLYYWTED